jgi:hypothetical protein
MLFVLLRGAQHAQYSTSFIVDLTIIVNLYHRYTVNNPRLSQLARNR